jgi:tetratricopeptide (TPR) repeat protein
MSETCLNCGNPRTCCIYRSAPIAKLKRFRRVGDRYSADHRLFRYSPDGPRLLRDDGRILSPDFATVYGDVFAYWIKMEEAAQEIPLCSRACAIEYSINHDVLLCRVTDSVIITPQQPDLDRYSQEHNLECGLATMESDTWQSPEDELRALLKAKLPFPKRFFTLGMVVLDKGMNSLCQAAVKKMLDDYPLDAVVDLCFMLLWRMGELDQGDSLYEKLLQEKGTYAAVGGSRLSNWALLVGGKDPQRALTLSQKAVALCPTSVPIIENHLMILCAAPPDEAMRFLSAHVHDLSSDVGFYAAGRIYMRSGQFASAEDYLRAADSCKADPITKRYLAETLFCLGRYADALNETRIGMGSLEDYPVDGLPDLDGVRRHHYEYPYQQKKSLRKSFLALEGKLLCTLGEEEAGKQRIRDCLDISVDVELGEELFADLNEYVGAYATREKLESDLAAAHLRIAAATQAADRQRFKVDSLGALIDAIAEVQSQWRNALISLKEDLLQDVAAESFASRIHTFPILLRRLNRDRYKEVRRLCRGRYQNLPEKVIEQLANADFLTKELTAFEGAPVYAGAVIETCKALETSLNRLLVETFVVNCNACCESAPLLINVFTRSGREFALALTYRGTPRHLMLGELASLCGSNERRWVDFLGADCVAVAGWVRSELPAILTTVKDQFRNGCAHYDSADRNRVVQLNDLLGSNRVFERLDALARTLSSQSRRGNARGSTA